MRFLMISICAVGLLACGDDNGELDDSVVVPYDGDYSPTSPGFDENGCLLEGPNIVLSLVTVIDGEQTLVELPEGTLLGADVDAVSTPVSAEGAFSWEVSGLYSTTVYDDEGDGTNCTVEVRASVEAKTIDGTSFDIVNGDIRMMPAPTMDDLCEEAFQMVAPGFSLGDGCVSTYSTIMTLDGSQ